MSQISQVQVNYNSPVRRDNITILPKSLVIGFSQRGPVYKLVYVTDIKDFLTVFGQPTNPFEFNFFQSVKSIVNANGVAICYRIPYSDKEKQLYDTKFEYYITDKDKIVKPVIEKIVLRDVVDSLNQYYEMYVDEKPNKRSMGLYIKDAYDPNYKMYFVLKCIDRINVEYYKMFIRNGKLYAELLDTPEDYIDEALDYLSFKYNETQYAIEIRHKKPVGPEVGVYLFELDDKEVIENTEEVECEYVDIPLTFDIIYKKFNDTRDFSGLSGVKLSFTLINDFDSVIDIKQTDSKTAPVYTLRSDCKTLKADIDPEQIIGIFPIVFGPKDADNLRKINLGELCYFTDKDSENYIDVFDTYTYRGTSNNVFPTYTDVFRNDLLKQFEDSSHFRKNWFEIEIGKLFDNLIPQDINICKNTFGVAFIALYLDDEHRVDYKVLESYFGLVGTSNKVFYNIEDQINEYSRFFNLTVEGEFETPVFTEGLNPNSLIYDKTFVVPLASPYTNIDEKDGLIVHDVEMYDIFEQTPINKFNKDFSQSLTQIHNKFVKTEFFNSAPFDYVIAPGLVDAILLKAYDNKPILSPTNNVMVPYMNYMVSFNKKEPITSIENTENVKSIYRLLALYTGFGDKGTIGFIDVPKIYNEYLRAKIGKYETDEQYIKQVLDECFDYSKINGIFPKLSGSREIYDRIYPIFNYQYVDKDSLLTRYHKHKRQKRFELVSCSTATIGAYISSANIFNFDPIAGVRSSYLFTDCHHAFMECNPQFLKILFDLFGVSSLINNKDNNTFPVQQTTWRNTMSVLKQLHAFRIYIEIRRRAYSIAKSYLYEPNTDTNRDNLKNALNSLLNIFKKNHYIDNNSFADVWADIPDIEGHQVQVFMVVGIYGAIVKIEINLNLQNMTIEIIQ